MSRIPDNGILDHSMPPRKFSFRFPDFASRVFQVYYSFLRSYATSMLMIVAAMEEELELARRLCPDAKRVQCETIKLWQATRREEPVCFLKAGVGPKRSAENLRAAVVEIRPSRILLIGYAGALDPGLKLGDLVAVRKALAFSLDESRPDWEHVRIDAEFDLAEPQSLSEAASAAGLNVRAGNAMTSAYVLGDPVHKSLLNEKFGGSIVDMETAALAGVAQSEGIPLSCIRVVSDEAQDTFLVPFSHNPSAGIAARAKKLMETGMVETFREWKYNTSQAKQKLSRFLEVWLI
jgi:nucleoside phosphorylase